MSRIGVGLVFCTNWSAHSLRSKTQCCPSGKIIVHPCIVWCCILSGLDNVFLCLCTLSDLSVLIWKKEFEVIPQNHSLPRYLWWWLFHKPGPTALSFSYPYSINNRWPYATVHSLQSRGLWTNYNLSVLCWKLPPHTASSDAHLMQWSSCPQKISCWAVWQLTKPSAQASGIEWVAKCQRWLLIGPFIVDANVLICVHSNPTYICHICRTGGTHKK